MAERHLAGKNLVLSRGTGVGSPEVFEVIACITNLTINQSSTDLNAVTNCGRVKLPDSKDASVGFDFLPTLSPDAGKASMATLQGIYKMDVVSPWKITTVNPQAGDPIFSLNGYLSELPWKGPASDFFTGSGTIQADEDGVDLTSVP